MKTNDSNEYTNGDELFDHAQNANSGSESANPSNPSGLDLSTFPQGWSTGPAGRDRNKDKDELKPLSPLLKKYWEKYKLLFHPKTHNLKKVAVSAIHIRERPLRPSQQGDNKKLIESLAVALLENPSSVAPLKLAESTYEGATSYVLIDGECCYKAAVLANVQELNAQIIPCDRTTAFMLSISANAMPGQGIAKRDIVKHLVMLFSRHPELMTNSQRRLADAFRISKTSVCRAMKAAFQSLAHPEGENGTKATATRARRIHIRGPVHQTTAEGKRAELAAIVGYITEYANWLKVTPDVFYGAATAYLKESQGAAPECATKPQRKAA